MPSRALGRVAALYRYPVKSMAAEPLESAEVSWHGIAGDRRWAFVRPGLERSNFPWLTIRERSELWGYRPRFADPAQPDASAVLVTTPAGDELDVSDPRLAAQLGDGVRVMKQNRGTFDAAPLSLTTTGSVAALSAMVEAPLDPLRFRPNLLVDAAGGEPFREDDWVGHTIRVGEMAFRVDQRDARCVMVNVDPTTHARDPRVLKAIAQRREACLGVYGSTVTPGVVSVGDLVTIDA